MLQTLLGRHKAMDVADHILILAKNREIRLDPLQLNKLLYITQCFSLGISGKPAFGDKIEAWKYGPVIKSIYKKFECHGNSKITHLTDHTPLNDSEKLPTPKTHAERT